MPDVFCSGRGAHAKLESWVTGPDAHMDINLLIRFLVELKTFRYGRFIYILKIFLQYFSSTELSGQVGEDK